MPFGENWFRCFGSCSSNTLSSPAGVVSAAGFGCPTGIAARFAHAVALDLLSFAGRADIIGEEEGVEDSEFVRQVCVPPPTGRRRNQRDDT